MSSFNSRRPNVTQYLRDLNALSPQETDNFNVDPDIAIFTNTEFFDFDSGQNTDYQPQPAPPVKSAIDTSINQPAAEDVGSAIDDISNMDFMTGDFSFTDFAQSAYPTPSTMNTFPEGAPAYPAMPPVFNGHPQTQAQNQVMSQPVPHAADVRKSEDTKRSGSGALEDASRVAAEDDKRRRNTAASARFRVKKKQREQALEKSAKEMSDKVSALENKVSQLETENKWLKNLLVEKNDSTEDISTLWKEFTKHAAERIKAKAGAQKLDGRS